MTISRLVSVSLLSHQDSNLGKQNQNLMCYHYTMGQSKLKNEN